MNAYLFSAESTFARIDREFRNTADTGGTPVLGYASEIKTWDVYAHSIVLAESAEAAREIFHAWLMSPKDEITRTIKKIVASQLIDQLFTEAGRLPFDWPRICGEADASFETMPPDDGEQGYWANVNRLVPPGAGPSSAGELEGRLSEDDRAALNWSPEKTFFFIVNALDSEALRAEEIPATLFFEHEEASEDQDGTDGVGNCIPEIVEREATALVKTRNAVVAAWLWRQFAANTPLAANPISIIPWCGVISGSEKIKP